MKLLDFPLEIFGVIILEPVEEVGAADAMDLRNVCTTFSRAITYEVLAKQPLAAFKDEDGYTQGKNWDVLYDNDLQYLYYRTKQPLDSLPLLPTMINMVVDHLCSNSENTSSHDREYWLRKVCRIAKKSGGDEILNELYYRMAEGSEAEHLFAAMSAMGNTQMLRACLDHLPSDAKKDSSLFGNPVMHAVEQESSQNTKLILDHLQMRFQAIRPAHNSREFLEFLFFVHRPLSEAMRRGNVEITRQVFQWHRTNLGDPSKREYHIWLDQAVRSGNVDIVEICFTIKVGQPRVSQATFDKAIRKKNVKIISALLGRGRMSANKTSSRGCPLAQAIVTDEKEIVKAVLDAGALPNGPKCYDAGRRNQLLDLIRTANEDVIKLLIERGATLT